MEHVDRSLCINNEMCVLTYTCSESMQREWFWNIFAFPTNLYLHGEKEKVWTEHFSIAQQFLALCISLSLDEMSVEWFKREDFAGVGCCLEADTAMGLLLVWEAFV